MTGDAEARPPRGFAATLGVWLRELAIVVVGALIASTLLRLFIAQMFVIPSGSMEHTLEVGDRVAVQKVAGFQRGDVVVFRDTLDWLQSDDQDLGWLWQTLIFVGLAPDESTKHLIKRVIGVAGDHVTCCDAQGRLTVNGVALNEVSYLYTDSGNGQQVDPSTMQFDIVVPAGTIFVMGDHRNASNDSRCRLADVSQNPGQSAFVPMDKVVGSAVAIVAPLDRLSTFNLPATFTTVPDPVEPAPERPELIHVESGC